MHIWLIDLRMEENLTTKLRPDLPLLERVCNNQPNGESLQQRDLGALVIVS